jgi:hypothetical protein
VKLRVKAVEVDSAKGADGKPINATQKHLHVRVEVQNGHATRPVVYSGSASLAMLSGPTAPKLTDNLGNTYKPMFFGEKPVLGQLKTGPVPADKSVTDVIIFENPVAKVEYLRLEVPGGNFGVSEGALRLQIPPKMVAIIDTPPPPETRTVVELQKALKSKDKDERAIAAFQLGHKYGAQSAPAVNDLIAALKDPEADVRAAAAEALGKVGPAAKPSAPTLVLLLNDPEESVARKAFDSLKKLEFAPPPPPKK